MTMAPIAMRSAAEEKQAMRRQGQQKGQAWQGRAKTANVPRVHVIRGAAKNDLDTVVQATDVLKSS